MIEVVVAVAGFALGLGVYLFGYSQGRGRR